MRRMICAVVGLGLILGWCAASQAGGKANPLAGEVLRVLVDQPENPVLLARLRAAGQPAIDELTKMRDQLQASLNKETENQIKGVPHEVDGFTRRLAKLDEVIDRVGMQKYCSRSRLFWHTDFEAAKTAARESGKPILSLRMLGNLNEEFSCANSRFFRTTLYANEEISKALRENYVLHWKSVRPVPKVTIDFGDGRKLERTVTGNSIHYILTPDGDVVEALPGLYGPKAFLQKISEGASLARSAAALEPSERNARLVAYHAAAFRDVTERFQADLQRVSTVSGTALAAGRATVGPEPAADAVPLRGQDQAPPRADVAGERALPKARIERPLVAAALPLVTSPDQLQNEATWQAIAALHADEARVDNASRNLIRSENPTAAAAGRLAITKRQVEDPLVRLVASLESSIALDAVRNEYQLHRQIHGWLAEASYKPDIDTLNERVYTQLFLTPSNDPWLGLAPADVYTALPNGGVVRSGK